MVKPITPEEVQDKKNDTIPSEVVEAFNELIVENWSKVQARVTQRAAVVRIKKKLPAIPLNDLYENNWLDVEALYRKAGWKVSYESPSMDESFEPYYIFSK